MQERERIASGELQLAFPGQIRSDCSLSTLVFVEIRINGSGTAVKIPQSAGHAQHAPGGLYLM